MARTKEIIRLVRMNNLRDLKLYRNSRKYQNLHNWLGRVCCSSQAEINLDKRWRLSTNY